MESKATLACCYKLGFSRFLHDCYLLAFFQFVANKNFWATVFHFTYFTYLCLLNVYKYLSWWKLFIVFLLSTFVAEHLLSFMCSVQKRFWAKQMCYKLTQFSSTWFPVSFFYYRLHFTSFPHIFLVYRTEVSTVLPVDQI